MNIDELDIDKLFGCQFIMVNPHISHEKLLSDLINNRNSDDFKFEVGKCFIFSLNVGKEFCYNIIKITSFDGNVFTYNGIQIGKLKEGEIYVKDIINGKNVKTQSLCCESFQLFDEKTLDYLINYKNKIIKEIINFEKKEYLKINENHIKKIKTIKIASNEIPLSDDFKDMTFDDFHSLIKEYNENKLLEINQMKNEVSSELLGKTFILTNYAMIEYCHITNVNIRKISKKSREESYAIYVEIESIRLVNDSIIAKTKDEILLSHLIDRLIPIPSFKYLKINNLYEAFSDNIHKIIKLYT